MEENKELSKHDLKELKKEKREEERHQSESQGKKARMLRNVKKYSIIAVILIAIVSVWSYTYTRPGKYDGFASCLAEKNAKFFGSFQCSNCADQKRLFGKSTNILMDSGVYIECGPLSGPQAQVCIDNSIDSYPTWEFADKTRLIGTRQLSELSEKSGCII